MRLAVHDDVATATEADLQLDLIAVRVRAHTAAGRDRLVTHRQRRKAREVRRQLRIGVAIRRHWLPVRRTLVRLDDDGVAARRGMRAHDLILRGKWTAA